MEIYSIDTLKAMWHERIDSTDEWRDTKREKKGGKKMKGRNDDEGN